MKTYEYKFVRVGEYAVSALFGVRDRDRNTTRASCTSTLGTVGASCRAFAPGVAAFGAAKYYELIFERETPKNAMRSTTEPGAERVGV